MSADVLAVHERATVCVDDPCPASVGGLGDVEAPAQPIIKAIAAKLRIPRQVLTREVRGLALCNKLNFTTLPQCKLTSVLIQSTGILRLTGAGPAMTFCRVFKGDSNTGGTSGCEKEMSSVFKSRRGPSISLN